MATLGEICLFLDKTLETDRYEDSSLNGLQVAAYSPSDTATPEGFGTTISKVAYSVDAGLSVIERAVQAKADLLIVHHGLFWGGCPPITGKMGKKISLLIRNNCSLYCSHLPLDGHAVLGNAAVIAEKLELTNRAPFCAHRDMYIGMQGELSTSESLQEFQNRVENCIGSPVQLTLPFGKNSVRKVGIVTGSGSFAIDVASRNELDVLLTGESTQAAFHSAKEWRMNAVFAGHYATETFGVAAASELLRETFGVTVEFIDEPTGI